MISEYKSHNSKPTSLGYDGDTRQPEQIHCRIVDGDTRLVQSCANVQTISEVCRFFREHGFDFSDSTAKDLNGKATFEIVTPHQIWPDPVEENKRRGLPPAAQYAIAREKSRI